MEEEIKKMMASVFMCDVSKINENSDQDSISEWDSLKHINLMVALEEEFGVLFTDDEMVKMLNYKLILETIKHKLHL